MNYITKISDTLFLPTPTNALAKNRLLYRILVSISIDLLVNLACWRALSKFELGTSDFTWAIRTAQDLLNGRNPYNYPLPAALVGLPLLALFKWRNRDSWLLLIAAILPQRWFYNNFILWLIPKTRRKLN